jgi:hypothetical protein
MADLSEMEMRILSELTEDWENFPTIANTVTLRTGNDSERLEIKEALKSLIESDLVLIAAPPSGGADAQELSKMDSLTVVSDLEKHLQFDAATGYWDGGAAPLPEISITSEGLKQVDEIRDERPERWWWPENRR